MRPVAIWFCAVLLVGCGSSEPSNKTTDDKSAKEAMLKQKALIFDERGSKNQDKSK